MKKHILLLLLLFFYQLGHAQTIQAKYTVSYGSFIELGIATSTLNIKENTYSIVMEAKTTGMAKYLSRNRMEIYESHGEIIDNLFIPKTFIKTKKDDLKQRVKTYTFDQTNQKIVVKEIHQGKHKKIDATMQELFEPFYEETNEELDYFASDDILSLFFNMHEKMVAFEDGEEYTLKAIGANKTKGKITILMPSKAQKEALDKVLKTEDKAKFTAYINQKIFQSERGELLISLNDYGFCSYAILKDVLLFGDIVGKMVEFRIEG